MRLISEDTGIPNVGVGKSLHDKLLSMKVDPALALLQNESWRDFFTKHKQSPVKQKKQQTAAQQEQVEQRNLDEIFYSMLTRIEDFWVILKIPQVDRKFYRKSLCKGPPQSIDHCREVASYVNMLKHHQKDTMLVLQSIELREIAVSKAYDVIAALHRKVAKGSDVRLSAARPISANQQLNSDFWKEEFLYTLDDVRCTTLEVIKNIQGWRRNLWRPKPFVWRDVNYLSKIKYDMNVLESETYRNLLGMVPLKYEDLLCVVFFNPDLILQGDGEEGAEGAEGEEKECKEEDAQRGGDLKLIIKEFLNNIDKQELHAAATVVMDDSMLQNAIQIEHQSLVAKGTFIPTLKLTPAEPISEEDAEVEAEAEAEGSFQKPDNESPVGIGDLSTA